MTTFNRADNIDELVDLWSHLKDWESDRLRLLVDFIYNELNRREPPRLMSQEDIIREVWK